MKEEISLKGLTAIITGSSRGIGFATAQYLGEIGANIMIADIDSKAAEKSASGLCEMGINASSCMVDVSKGNSVKEMVATTNKVFGSISILVNNAGIHDNKPIPEISADDWKQVIDINLGGVHFCSQAVLKVMMGQKFGRIVNIGSMAGQTGGVKAGADYASSKAGIYGLTKSYARFGAKYGINVNAIAPGFIESDMTKGWTIFEDIPLKRLGTPLDVARVVYFLVSPLSDYITGQVISVNGGILMP